MSKHLRTEELDELGLQNSIKKMKIDITNNDNNQINQYTHISDPVDNNNTSCNLNIMMDYESEEDYYKRLKEMNQYLGYLHKLKIQRIIEKTKPNNSNNFNNTSINSSSSDHEPMDI